MFDFTSFHKLGVIAAGITIGTATMSLADPGRYIPVLEQRGAILDCRYDMGLHGAARFGAVWPELPPGGQTVTWIVPGPNLSPEQADRVNACADERLGRAQTPRFATQAQSPAERAEYRKCPPGAPILLGGAAYCIKRR
ncbi:hypothetical protein [Roseovarius autotrophicus]|uniref:hypothetical protein n=1 Tax=Roseovarius autotrophicus TaxID=2824121 RepID=UPI001B35B8DA|nr:hypothetical protein [Roseovarius autotrophicus]